jgi:ABC-2 type transport system ATP-binding protein
MSNMAAKVAARWVGPGRRSVPSAAVMASIEVDGLVVRHGDLEAVRGASFAAEAGAVTVLLGPNGAGKTTTVETIEGYRRPDAGVVRVLGLDPLADAAAVRPRVGVMLQSGGVHPGLRPLEAIRLHAALYPTALDPVALLDRVGLSDRARSTWRRLSGGEQQRLSLALAVVGRPDVVLLDEPTAGVDLDGRRIVRDLIAELRADGVAVLLTTHDLDEAERVADRIIIIDHGVVVADAPAAELLATAGTDDITFAATPGLDVAALGGRLGAPASEIRPGEYVVAVPPTPANVAALTGWLAEHDVALGDLRAGKRRLEDVFERLTAGEAPAAEAGRSRRSRR